jgi:parallel beta-helix repeat protein
MYKKTTLTILFAITIRMSSTGMAQNVAPIADAGSSRYVAEATVKLDGTGSYDPDESGPVIHVWRQILGPEVVIADENTASPMISGFSQTGEIQECEFELTVSDGELTGLPDIVKVVVVPRFGKNQLELINDVFDPHKPTIIYFGGGDCVNGLAVYSDCPLTSPEWLEKANVMSAPNGYSPDPGGGKRTYYQYGDMLLVYLSSVAPDYKQPIQTCGWSTGGQPAIDVGRHINLTYQDRRYAVNRVTFFDTTPYCRDYSDSILVFLSSSVDGEQCWIDNYVSSSAWNGYTTYPYFYNSVLNTWFETGAGSSAYGSSNWWKKHRHAQEWYNNSLGQANMNRHNSGLVAGAYWSVIGPGKNLQLASTPDTQTYKFQWNGWNPSDYMDFYDEADHSGRLPEPVRLIGPLDGSVVDANGAVFSCEESENAVGYQLLFGPGPDRVMDYYTISDTSSPPSETITSSPFEKTWWTVKVRDRYGSTIYADPICIYAENVEPRTIENVSIGKEYSSIQDAIDDALPGGEIVVSKGIWQENISFKGKNLTLRSVDPGDPGIVATTVIRGNYQGPVVTFSSGEELDCVLAGVTITGGARGIHCSGSYPTISNSTIVGNLNADLGAGMYLGEGSHPTLLNCLICKNSASKMGGGIYSSDSNPTLINCTFSENSAALFGGGMFCTGGSPLLNNCILWNDTPAEIFALNSTVVIAYSNVQGGFFGAGNIDVDPLFSDPGSGDFHLKSHVGRWDVATSKWVMDEVASPCIDLGDPSMSVGEEPLPNGNIINMGAYGGTVEASKSQ